MKKIIYSLFLVILFTSCGSYKVLNQNVTMREYNASYEKTFNSAISVLHAQGFMLEKADKDVGLITAGRNVKSGWFLSRHIDRQLISIHVENVEDEKSRVSVSIYSKDLKSKDTNRDINTRYVENRSVLPEGYFLSTNSKDYIFIHDQLSANLK